MSSLRSLRIAAGLGLVAALAPLLMYFWARFVGGSLPSAQAWWAQGNNHGPWRWEWPMVLVAGPMYALAAGAVLVPALGAVGSIKTRRWAPVVRSVAIGGLYGVLFAALAGSVYWTID